MASGAVSHAPAATTLNRQKTMGAVAICAASETASPPKSHPGRSGKSARIGSVKRAMPQTAANVRTQPTERPERERRRKDESEEAMACAAGMAAQEDASR
jgi:hypothetical protein